MSDAEIRNISLVDESGERRVRMGNLAFVGAHSINGVSALHTELMKETVFKRPAPDVPGADQQQDQRHHAAALADAVQPRADRADRRHDRRRLPRRHRAAARPREPRRGPGLPGRLRPRQAAEQGPAGQAGARPAGDPGRPERDVRHPGQAHPRVQAPAPEHHRDRGALRPDPLAPGAELGAAGQVLRRQGGADLSQRQADHKARQRRGAGDQREPDGPQRAEGRLRAELQRQPRRGAGAGRRPLRADLDRGPRGERNRQHEVRAERRDHHRHPRRRQRRDPRDGRPREHPDLRAEGGGGRRSAAPAATTRAPRSSARPSSARR